MRVLVPVGTRPEIVKLAPVVAALQAAGHDTTVVATGQHYDANLTDALFDGLALRPDVRWTLSGDEASRVGQLTQQAFAGVAELKPEAVLVLGDTYTVPAFGWAARRAQVPVVHLEAGLRSRNPTSMEEVNRRMVAAVAALHLAPTDLARQFLLDEGTEPARVHVVGNPIIDVLRLSGKRASPGPERTGVVVTAHRATNVDDPARLEALIALLHRLADEVGPVTFPMHPRTRSRLAAVGALSALETAVHVLEPIPWDEMIDLMATSRLVVTDSGGLQEETSYLGVPAVVLRRSTPRWEGVRLGSSVLVGLDVDRAMAAAHDLTTDEALARIAALPCPYGDGHTSARVAALLSDPATAPLLAIEEPDFVGREL